MAKRKITVKVTRTYFKTAEVEIEVDSEMTNKDISDFVAFDTDTNNRIDEALASASLSGEDDEYEYIYKAGSNITLIP